MASQRYAVLIGNGTFTESQQQLRPLRCPTNDVTSLAELLSAAQHGGYAVTTIVDATHDVVRRAVYKCLQTAQHDDLVLIYFSGHGKLDQDGNLYLVTRDTSISELPPTSFPVDDLKRYIRDSRVATTIVILDCCFSGAVKALYKGEDADQAATALTKLEDQGTFYLTASTDTQLAEEKEGDEYSLLTKHIIAGIRDGVADLNDDGQISFQELCLYVQKQIPKEGTQRPRSWSLNAAGDVTVAMTGKPAAEVRRRAVVKRLYELATQDLLTDEVVSALLKLINLPLSTQLQDNFTVKNLIDSLHIKRPNALFLQEVFQLARADEERRKTEEQILAEKQRRDDQLARADEERQKTEEQTLAVEQRLKDEEQARATEERRKTEEQIGITEHNRKAEEQASLLRELEDAPR
jgi:hypothetical protein